MAATLRDYLVRIIAQSEGVTSAIKGVEGLDKGIKSLAGQVVRAALNIKTLARYATDLGKKIRELTIEAVNIQDNLEQTAKKLNMTTEKARAHQIALAVMGKTLQEINQDATLKKTYDDLVKLGEGLALPDASKGLTAIKNIKNSINSLRVTLRYGFQWIYYYLQKYLATPLGRLRNWINDKNSDFGEKVKTWANSIAKVLANLYDIAVRLVKDIKHIWDGIKSIWNSVSGEGKAALIGLIGLLAMILDKGLAIKLMIGGLILALDDFFTWLEGGESVLGDLWSNVIAFLINIRNTIAMIINYILDALDAVISYFDEGFEGIPFRFDIYNTEAIQDFLKNTREENKKKAEEENQKTASNTEAAATNANASAAGGGGANPYANGAQANTYAETQNNVNSNNTTTNTYNVNVNINATGSSDAAQQYADALSNATHNLGAATA